jgi:tRNA(His) guanylyltransferase
LTIDKAPRPGDTLGDRIKRYERASRPFLTPNSPVLVRVDGKAFHTWTKHMDKPFDHGLIRSMQEAVLRTAEQMQGFKLAYTQSDEATFMIADTDRPESQPWLDYNVNKLVSVTASMFTCHFNHAAPEFIAPSLAPAYFDARAFNVPTEDAPNAFLWRQRDWARNSLMMSAQYIAGHHRIQGKKRDQLHDLLHDFGFNWADLDPVLKNGTWVSSAGDLSHDKLDYSGIQALIDGPYADPSALLLVPARLAGPCPVVPVLPYRGLARGAAGPLSLWPWRRQG